MADEIQIDQETFDRLIAAGESERTARAKAKSVAVRKAKGRNRGVAQAAPAAAAAPADAAPVAAATSAQAPAAAPAAAAPAARRAAPSTGRLTPEERAARVAAAVASKGVPGEASAASGRAGETHRLLAMVPPEGIQRTEARQDDKVNSWPHLLNREAVASFAMLAFLVVFSTLVNAPLLEVANPNLTPNPSKAPWYFLGLQELLRYFHPMVAGVTIPGVGLLVLMAAPYVDRNPSVRPENRKLVIMLFTFFLMFWSILVIIGSFFRGPGFNWVWPWADGLFFEF